MDNTPETLIDDKTKGQTPMRSVWLIAGITVVVVVVFVGIFNLLNPIWRTMQNIEQALNPRTMGTIGSSQTIVTGIKPLGQLVSISVQLAKADIAVNVSQGLANACGFSANHVVQGTVEAGIDLTLIDENTVQYDEATDTYTLSVPSPQLTSCRVDFIRQYDRSSTACNVDWDEARLLANYDAIVDFREDAIAGGVLTRAQQEADTTLTQFIQLLTGSKVVIEFSGAGYQIPPSCQPAIPPSWNYDMNTGQWVKN